MAASYVYEKTKRNNTRQSAIGKMILMLLAAIF